jgi:hypothetical protein
MIAYILQSFPNLDEYQFILGVIIGINLVTPLAALQSAEAVNTRSTNDRSEAPSVISGDNVYIAWWNGTEGQPDKNVEVLFRVSTDSGTTFGDKINLSNSTDADSVRAQISAEGGTVLVTYWELNQTSTEPVGRMSTDNGATFGPILRLVANGTIGEATEEEPEEEE